MGYMKKNFIFFTLLFFWPLAAYAASSDQDRDTDLTPRNLKDDAFVVSTDEANSADSLNRISGQFDRGFTSPDQTYQSERNYKPGPFSKAAAEDAAQRNNS